MLCLTARLLKRGERTRFRSTDQIERVEIRYNALNHNRERVVPSVVVRYLLRG